MMLTDLETDVMMRVFREELTAMESGVLVHYYGVGEVERMDVPAISRLFAHPELNIANCIHHALAKLEPVVVDRLDKVRPRPSQIRFTPQETTSDEDEDEE